MSWSIADVLMRQAVAEPIHHCNVSGTRAAVASGSSMPSMWLLLTFKIEIMIAARSDRALARVLNPIVLEARQTLNGIWIETLGAAGYPRDNAQQFIELTHYLLR